MHVNSNPQDTFVFLITNFVKGVCLSWFKFGLELRGEFIEVEEETIELFGDAPASSYSSIIKVGKGELLFDKLSFFFFLFLHFYFPKY